MLLQKIHESVKGKRFVRKVVSKELEIIYFLTGVGTMILTRLAGTDGGCKCVECKKNDAEVRIVFGVKANEPHRNVPMQTVVLCKECAWNLGDCLDDTTATSWKESSK